MRLETKTMTMLFAVNDVVVNYKEVMRTDIDDRGYSDADSVNSESIVGEKKMKLAFFIDGEKILDAIHDTNMGLFKSVFYEVLMVVLLCTLILVILGVMRVKRLAYKMTAQIIHLYETLYQIAQDRKDKQAAVELSFKRTSKELNELHLTFNRVCRTINLASQSMSDIVTEE